MVIYTQFNLESIKEQLALIKSITSHLDFSELSLKEDLDPNFEKMLKKLDNSSRNLTQKYEHLNQLLNN